MGSMLLTCGITFFYEESSRGYAHCIFNEGEFGLSLQEFVSMNTLICLLIELPLSIRDKKEEKVVFHVFMSCDGCMCQDGDRATRSARGVQGVAPLGGSGAAPQRGRGAMPPIQLMV
ncbi:hypothetical protein CsSME_00002825 [Camellia sinensis var. sinensis]